MDLLEDLQKQNQILRERIERLESVTRAGMDPVLTAFVEHASVFVTVINPDGLLLATGRTSEAFGSVIGRKVFEFVQPEQHEVLRRAFAKVCAIKQPVVDETVGFGENGEPNHAYVTRAVPLIENDVVNAIALVSTDVTDRVNLERSLAQSEEKLRLAIGASRMGLWRWEVESGQVIWDERMLQIFQVSAAPRDYAEYLALVHPDDLGCAREVLDNALETGGYQALEHRLAAREGGADGDEHWVLSTATVLRNDNGRRTLMGGALDITEQKRSAAQLQRAQRVEALGQLTAGLAHNFNNLLVVIIPNLELALQQAPKEQAPLLSAAMDASLQARDLIKRLMAITRRPSTSSSKSSRPGEVLERTVAICRATFPREIEIALTIHPDVGHVAMDAADLDQVVLNLLFNARDALEQTTGRERRIEVTLDTVRSAGSRRFVRVRVRDTGPGMSREVHARIFEPFFTTKPAHRGSGLGLSDVIARVRASGGTLECQSSEGAGATFTLLLPEASACLATPPPVAGPSKPARGETILIIDDEPTVRAVVARLLRQEGYEVLEAQSATEARAVLASNRARVRLVLLDQSMPHESGPEALPSLKHLSDAPVVMFTGSAIGVPAGAVALLEKPATGQELLRLVRDLLDRDPRSL